MSGRRNEHAREEHRVVLKQTLSLTSYRSKTAYEKPQVVYNLDNHFGWVILGRTQVGDTAFFPNIDHYYKKPNVPGSRDCEQVTYVLCIKKGEDGGVLSGHEAQTNISCDGKKVAYELGEPTRYEPDKKSVVKHDKKEPTKKKSGCFSKTPPSKSKSSIESDGSTKKSRKPRKSSGDSAAGPEKKRGSWWGRSPSNSIDSGAKGKKKKKDRKSSKSSVDSSGDGKSKKGSQGPERRRRSSSCFGRPSSPSNASSKDSKDGKKKKKNKKSKKSSQSDVSDSGADSGSGKKSKSKKEKKKRKEVDRWQLRAPAGAENIETDTEGNKDIKEIALGETDRPSKLISNLKNIEDKPGQHLLQTPSGTNRYLYLPEKKTQK